MDDTSLSNGGPLGDRDLLAGAGPLVQHTVRNVLEQQIAIGHAQGP